MDSIFYVRYDIGLSHMRVTILRQNGWKVAISCRIFKGILNVTGELQSMRSQYYDYNKTCLMYTPINTPKCEWDKFQKALPPDKDL